jgi:alpha-tubulin suppressor-like RCC1 family protein
VAAGLGFSAYGLNPGSGLSWGQGDRLGAGDGLPARLAPGPMPLVNAVALAAGAGHGGAIDDQGRAWAWGGNSFGQLGRGNLDPSGSVTQIAFGSRFQAVALGTEHSLWLRTDGLIEAAGFNGVGALGQPDSVYLSQTLVLVPGSEQYTAIAAGNNFSLAVRSDGTLWVWGTNLSGQHGRNPGTSPNIRGTKYQVPGLPNGLRAVAAGNRHALALTSAGEVWAWGEAGNGKLGIGQTSAVWMPPTRVALTGNFVAVACGTEFSLALRDDGVLYAWGIDETGQLGQGAPRGMSNVPLVVPGLPPIRAMDGGWGPLGHTVAVAQDGTVWAWGRNNDGQLGDGTRVDRAAPVRVIGTGP